jgi:hypothetical protein
MLFGAPLLILCWAKYALHLTAEPTNMGSLM